MPDSFDDWTKKINPYRYPGAPPEPPRVEHIPVPGEGYETVRKTPLPDFAHDPDLIYIPGEPAEKSVVKSEQFIPGEGMPDAGERERSAAEDWENFKKRLEFGIWEGDRFSSFGQDAVSTNRTNPAPQAGYEPPRAGRYPEPSGASAPNRYTKEDSDYLERAFRSFAADPVLPAKLRQQAKETHQKVLNLRGDQQSRAVSHEEVIQRLNADYFDVEDMLLGDPTFEGDSNVPTSMDLPWGEEFI